MKTVAAIYTTYSIIEPIKAIFAELMPGQRLINVFDDSLIPDVITAGNNITTDVRRRLFAYCRACEDMGADVILSTCSSMGDIVEQIQPFVKVPILRIDEAMVRQGCKGISSLIKSHPKSRFVVACNARWVKVANEELPGVEVVT